MSGRQRARGSRTGAHGGGVARVFRHNGLTLALLVLFLLFLASFALHLRAGHAAFDANRAHLGLAPSSWSEYLADPEPWFESFQNWQSEFLSVAVVVVLSIFLRQIGSPESKPVHAPHARTGR